MATQFHTSAKLDLQLWPHSWVQLLTGYTDSIKVYKTSNIYIQHICQRLLQNVRSYINVQNLYSFILQVKNQYSNWAGFQCYIKSCNYVQDVTTLVMRSGPINIYLKIKYFCIQMITVIIILQKSVFLPKKRESLITDGHLTGVYRGWIYLSSTR